MMEVFDRYILRPFVYGESDCCQFAAACIEHQTGENPARGIEYSNEEQARALIRAHGGLCGLVSHFLGDPVEVPQDGYIALVRRPTLLGVVYRGRIVARTPGDINDIPLERAERFWSPWPS